MLQVCQPGRYPRMWLTFWNRLKKSRPGSSTSSNKLIWNCMTSFCIDFSMLYSFLLNFVFALSPYAYFNAKNEEFRLGRRCLGATLISVRMMAFPMTHWRGCRLVRTVMSKIGEKKEEEEEEDVLFRPVLRFPLQHVTCSDLHPGCLCTKWSCEGKLCVHTRHSATPDIGFSDIVKSHNKSCPFSWW